MLSLANKDYDALTPNNANIVKRIITHVKDKVFVIVYSHFLLDDEKYNDSVFLLPEIIEKKTHFQFILKMRD